MKISTVRLIRIALYTALALVMGLVESVLPPILWFAPGVKLGFANLVILIELFTDGIGSGYITLTLKCVLLSLIVGNPTSMLYSLPASLLSFTLEVVLAKLALGKIGIISISVVGAIVYNALQTMIASLVISSNILPLMVYFLPASLLAGAFTGAVALVVLKKLPEKFYCQ